jgi:type VI secretion system secreted protein VgrG
MNINNSPAQTAQGDLTAAYNDAAGRTSVTHVPELGGLTLTPGVYSSATGFLISTMLTLDAQSNPNAVFIFQAGSGLTDSASVTLINGAQASNVFWQVGSSAAINGANFVGTILALTSITFGTGSEFEGRALARNGLVSLQGQGGGLDTPTPANSPTQTPTSSPTQTVTPTTTVSPTTTYSPTNTATITPTVAGLGILALAPVPVRAGGNVILFFDKAPASTAWEIYNVAGERVARLSFNGFPGPQSHYWQTAGVAPGVYFVKVQIAYRDGTNIQIIRKAVVVP